MGRTRQILAPDIGVIVQINRRFIESSGEEYVGLDNLQNRISLEYILQIVSEETGLFGIDIYPSLFEKAAAIADRIIPHHVFWGACKRTALMTAIIFLELNGWNLEIESGDRFDEEAIAIALQFQEHCLSFQDLVSWIESRSTIIP